MSKFEHAFLLPVRLSSIAVGWSWGEYGIDTPIELQIKAVPSRSPSPESEEPAAKCVKSDPDAVAVVARLGAGAFR